MPLTLQKKKLRNKFKQEIKDLYTRNYETPLTHCSDEFKQLTRADPTCSFFLIGHGKSS